VDRGDVGREVDGAGGAHAAHHRDRGGHPHDVARENCGEGEGEGGGEDGGGLEGEREREEREREREREREVLM
jgi:hypothetical protein